MERPQTRRGSSQTGNYWDNPESGGPPSSAGQSDISPRPPTGRMVTLHYSSYESISNISINRLLIFHYSQAITVPKSH